MNVIAEEDQDEINQSGMVKGVPRYVLDQINSQSDVDKNADYFGPRSSQFAFLLDGDDTLSQALSNDEKLREPIGQYKLQMEARKANFQS